MLKWGEIMKKICVFFMVLSLSNNFYAQRFLLDSTKQNAPRVRTKAVISKKNVQKKGACTTKKEPVCDKNSMPCGRPEWICSPCERVKSDYFRYGPYTYPYIYNQPGFYFGTGIPNIHYW